MGTVIRGGGLNMGGGGGGAAGQRHVSCSKIGTVICGGGRK